ncbi:type I restriction enzyme HsdR N-terminal domain-containing protein [Candidatus Karelsulcia muelleri]
MNDYFNKMKTINLKGKVYVFCFIRKQYYLLTQEEWVRQYIIYYIINKRGYNVKDIYVELKAYRAHMTHRMDIIVFKNKRPFIIVECKSKYVNISYTSCDQLMKYYLICKSKYIVLTNGIKTIIFGVQNKGKDIEFLKDIPHNY